MEGYTASDDYQGSPHRPAYRCRTETAHVTRASKSVTAATRQGLCRLQVVYLFTGFQPELAIFTTANFLTMRIDNSEVYASAAGDELFVQRRLLREARFFTDHLIAGWQFQADLRCSAGRGYPA